MAVKCFKKFVRKSKISSLLAHLNSVELWFKDFNIVKYSYSLIVVILLLLPKNSMSAVTVLNALF